MQVETLYASKCGGERTVTSVTPALTQWLPSADTRDLYPVISTTFIPDRTQLARCAVESWSSWPSTGVAVFPAHRVEGGGPWIG